MRLLIVNKLYPPDAPGGAETIAKALAEAHQRSGIDVTVATTADRSSVLEEQVEQIRVIRIPLQNFFWHNEARQRGVFARTAWHLRDWRNRAMASALEQVIRRVDPDVVAFHNLAGFSASAWGAARAAGKPALQVLHDYYHLCPRSQLFARGERCERRCTDCALFRVGRRAASNRLGAVVGVSQAVLDAHVSRGLFAAGPRRTVIHNALASSGAPRPPRASGARVFGYLGALSEWKGIRPMLDAFQRSLVRTPELRLRIAGTGDEEYVRDLRARYAHPSLEFLGKVRSAEFFRTVDALIVPSLWDDPLPTVIIEALSAGVPVVGAKRGGIPEMIEHQVNGLLYEPARSGELEQCLQRLASDPELLAVLAAGCAGGRWFSDQARMAAAHERVYESLRGMGA